MTEGAPLLAIDGWAPPPGGRGFFFRPAGANGATAPRLRGAYWSGRGRGVVAILQGRTEFIEKYYGVVARFLDLGYDVAALDWRGQGLSDRLLDDPRKGHVDDFNAYQRDLDALLAAIVEEGAPPPEQAARLMFAHSMGGAIGARALMRQAAGGARFAAAMFTAPMLQLAGGGARRFGMRIVTRLNRLAGRGAAYVAGAGPETIAETGFEDNVLTSDRRHFDVYAGLVSAHPGLAIGGPTWDWLGAALSEMRRLRPSATPTMAALGEADQVVDNAAARAYAQATPKGRTIELQGARHEPYLEAPAHLDRLWRGVAGFLDEVGA